MVATGGEDGVTGSSTPRPVDCWRGRRDTREGSSRSTGRSTTAVSPPLPATARRGCGARRFDTVEALRLSADDWRRGAGAVSFSPDGDRLAVSDWHALSTKIFDVSVLGGGELFNLESEPRTEARSRPTRSSPSAGTGSSGRPISRPGASSAAWTSPRWAARRFAEVDPAGKGVAVQPFDESSLTLGAGGGEVEIRDLADSSVRARLDVSDGTWIPWLAWSADGSFVVVAERPGGGTDGLGDHRP